MNKKGELATSQIGLLIMVAVAVIVGAVLMQGTADHIGTATGTSTFTGQITPPATTVTNDLTGQELISLTSLVNESGDIDCSANYTVDEGVSTTTALKRVRITGGDITAGECSDTLNVTYVFGPEGYIDSAAGRSVAALILIFFALGIGVLALIPVTRDKLFDIIGKIK